MVPANRVTHSGAGEKETLNINAVGKRTVEVSCNFLNLFLKSVWKKLGRENGSLGRGKVCQCVDLSPL